MLDSCENVIEAAAILAEEIFKGTKGTFILATSRESLRAEGEHVYRLSPLDVPAETAELKAAEALAFPSVQLFVERAAASSGDFELTDRDAPLVADICRRLDGIALAIEIAAGRVDAFGVTGLASLLNDRFQLLMQGRRTALPRHRTLSATLDWSYSHLPEFERLVLRRLAVFAGPFTMESASAILAGTGIVARPRRSMQSPTWSSSRSLSADTDRAIAFYRLLDTTRDYSLVQARRERRARPDRPDLMPSIIKALLEQAQADWETRPATEWLAAPPAPSRQCEGRVGLGLFAFGRCGDRRGSHDCRHSALVSALAHQRMRRAHRPRARRAGSEPRRRSATCAFMPPAPGC